MLNVKQICKKRGISQAELASKLSISPSALSQRIVGNPTLDKIEDIAKALGVHISELFNRESTPTSGYIEHDGIITKISSVSDLEDVLKEIRGF